MFKNIVVAFVTDKHKKKTLNYALDIAKKYDAKLTILRCVEKESPKFGLFETKADKERYRKQREKTEKSLDIMEQAAKLFQIPMKSKIKLVDSVADCIIHFVETYQPDLVVLDAPKQIKIEDSYYHSILQTISKAIKCPLLTIT